jgi:hypothetical protein
MHPCGKLCVGSITAGATPYAMRLHISAPPAVGPNRGLRGEERARGAADSEQATVTVSHSDEDAQVVAVFLSVSGNRGCGSDNVAVHPFFLATFVVEEEMTRADSNLAVDLWPPSIEGDGEETRQSNLPTNSV